MKLSQEETAAIRGAVKPLIPAAKAAGALGARVRDVAVALAATGLLPRVSVREIATAANWRFGGALQRACRLGLVVAAAAAKPETLPEATVSAVTEYARSTDPSVIRTSAKTLREAYTEARVAFGLPLRPKRAPNVARRAERLADTIIKLGPEAVAAAMARLSSAAARQEAA
jgi:hypothetical protein